LHERFEVKRINHQEAYSLDGACTNWAEEYFSRLRRAEVGIHHHIAGAYLLRYAQEPSWREDNRRVSNGHIVAFIGYGPALCVGCALRNSRAAKACPEPQANSASRRIGACETESSEVVQARLLGKLAVRSTGGHDRRRP
jgi:ISXO2-like transposase domain